MGKSMQRVLKGRERSLPLNCNWVRSITNPVSYTHLGQLVGANRHQDFAYVGNALPNSQQWRDAKRWRDAGCTIIRVAHYPQHPAFMDACDEMGLFDIVATDVYKR